MDKISVTMRTSAGLRMIENKVSKQAAEQGEQLIADWLVVVVVVVVYFWLGIAAGALPIREPQRVRYQLGMYRVSQLKLMHFSLTFFHELMTLYL